VVLAVSGGVAALALGAAGCTGSPGALAAGAKAQGGTAVFALPPGNAPNYIFPFTSSTYINVINLQFFSYLLYRPLYWFGNGGQPTLNTSLSLADPPTWAGNTATITLKHYLWSNGTPVTTTDVMFWVNMLRAVGARDWGAYTGFPDAFVRSIKVVSPTKIQFTTNKAYSHTWFLSNDLSQITPMPPAWDRTAPGPSSCAANIRDCATVYNYLNAQAKQMTSYASSRLWGVVDGPWKLSAFSADGHLTFVPNPRYSGPIKPRLARFEEVPFTSDAAEYNVLRSSAAGGQKIDVGYLPQQDAPAKPAGAAAGANPVPGYRLSPWYTWGISYFVVNLQSTTGNGPIIRQLYFRQALEDLVNQEAVIKDLLRGYGTLTPGPVGSTPVTSYLSPALRTGNPFPYNPAAARSLLASHGWKVVPDGTTTCADPGRCGPGIKPGQPMIFTMPYATGIYWIALEMAQLQSSASQAGIKINLRPRASSVVTALAVGNCVVAKLPCNWDMAAWGGGWTFGPDYEPTGETLFLCGAIANSGGYCDKTNDALIEQTLTSDNLQVMYTWQDYLSMQLPMIWQAQPAAQLTEVASNLNGVTPQSPTLTINPENWYFT
jgi:peptide/nickel transport system substrate-binding protein